jgi:energy-coupling factor transporter ATP-binding protein EcfA2
LVHCQTKNWALNQEVITLTEIAIAVEVGAAVWRASEDLKLTEKIRDALRKKEVLIVLGASGAGKTNLIVSLNSAAGLIDAVWRINRTTTTVRKNVRINGQPFQVIDTPGAPLQQSDQLQAVRQVAAKPLVRVINVVSYGYHEYDIDTSNVIEPNGQPRPEFLENRRQEELRALQQWLPILGDRSITKWVTTVVAKADLWWSEQEHVLNHYRTGEYNSVITKTDPKLHHSVLPYCSVGHRFYNRTPLDGSFDDSDRVRINIHFLQQLVALG